MESILKQLLTLNHFSANSETCTSLIAYLGLVQEWNAHINITAHTQPSDLIEKDILDGFYLNQCIDQNRPLVASILDMGCGAGFSGIVLAILRAPKTIRIGFLDSDRKKMNFIRQAVRELQLKNCFFYNQRAEEGQVPPYEAVVSRATWKVEDLIKHAPNYVQEGGSIFSMSGPHQNFPSVKMLENQGLIAANEFTYQILPKMYDRKIFILQKKHST